MDLHSLPVVSALSDCVTIVEKDSVKIVRINHEKASAGIALHGGHVVSFTPAGQEDLIWMSDTAIFDGKAALRGGIPVCWPWFGRIAAPAHGFARNSTWELIEHRENDNGVIVELGLTSNEGIRQIWPHLFKARLIVEVTEQLKVTLKVENVDKHEWTFSGALHTYLNLGDIRQAKVTGIGPEYIDSLQNDEVIQGGQELVLSDTIDRVYTQPEADILVEDPVMNRTLTVTNQGHNSAVLWNPWAEGAQSMGDMPNDGYETFLCVESTLHAPSIEQGKTLQPGETYQLETVISA
ncbi:D-hexose-6-phosphate mutarotase [Vibrio japonicus]|uniref:Putative glucose-6-phosphate 1-epimerase n=1 Tax=Vibrio japonicus TaxID=1824638 RepID=A0ABY5LFN1_9VIBR|nr:D-hexose-6-phosphate mutarotase [Vibrio japonicus]UUM29760.1 D-hexose-6-phosphate mutarotase [Vibrio japonicus]